MDIEDLFQIITNFTIPDGRSFDPQAYLGEAIGGRLTGRHGTFNRDFYKGLRGERMGQAALEKHTWSNDGYRLGCFTRCAILLANGEVNNITDFDQKRLADSIFGMWSHLTRSVIESTSS